MRLLPCNQCHSGALTRAGNPYLLGSFSSPELVYKCWRCKRATRITRDIWNRLGEVSQEEVVKLFPSLTAQN